MIAKLVLDSLVALPYIPLHGNIIDIGSGAGIPGLPIKITRPGCLVHLLEARAKKVSFLRQVVRKLRLVEIEAFHGRAENSADIPELFPFYDVAITRALAPLHKTIALCAPFLNEGSLLITFKGQQLRQELQESFAALREEKLSIVNKLSYNLPEMEGERYLLVLKKGNP